MVDTLVFASYNVRTIFLCWRDAKMTEAIKKAIWAIWSKSDTEEVDVGVGAAMLRQDIRDGKIEDFTMDDADAAEKFAKKNYNAICEAYATGSIEALDQLQ